jgi:hypothetical protein
MQPSLTPITIGGQPQATIVDPTTGLSYIGGDADGDSIADSGLVRFPIGEINGVTYYYAIRIIDNNSAINASTAWYSGGDFDTSAAQNVIGNYGFFPSNVGLAEYLADYNAAATTAAGLSPNLVNFNTFRFNTTTNAPAPAGVPVTGQPYWDDGSQRSDFVYATQGDAFTQGLIHRINNPGVVGKDASNTNFIKFQAPSITDQLSLAYKFVLKNPNASPSSIESTATGLPASVYTHPNIKTKYTANQVALWYTDNFSFQPPPAVPSPLRSCLVTRNPVQNLVANMDPTAIAGYVATPTAMPALPVATTPMAPKVSINTADFPNLWRGFWNVMAEGTSIPNATDLAAGEAHMFRPTVRQQNWPVAPFVAPGPVLPYSQLLVRAAQAAVNTIDLRDNDYTVTTRTLYLQQHYYDGTAAVAPAEVTVYGVEPQPYITEVFANTDPQTGQNPKGYVAVELHNPYPFPISLANWQLGIVNRNKPAAGTVQKMKVQAITGFAGFGPVATAPTIPAGGYVVIENYSATPGLNDAHVRPAEVATQIAAIPPAQVFFVTNLHEVFNDPAVPVNPDPNSLEPSGGELILLRPRQAVLVSGVLQNTGYTRCADLNNKFDEQDVTTGAVHLYDLVPVDQFDFTNFALPGATTAYRAMHYVRENGTGHLWKFIYPGKYDANAIAPSMREENMAENGPNYIKWDPADATGGPTANVWLTTPPTPAFGFGLADAASSYVNNVPPIQLVNTDWAGPNKANGVPTKFPFGQFPRIGDMLQIPYIGGYRARELATPLSGSPPALKYPTTGAVGEMGTVLEMNAVTWDCSYARDGSDTDNADEAIGRFCPLSVTNPSAATPYTTPPTAPYTDKYYWAAKFFDYFTTWSPADDYFPNVDPTTNEVTGTARYNPNPTAPPPPTTQPVPNTAATAGTPNVGEEIVPVEGLININTASWYVLKAIPWSTTPANNQLIAQYIAAYRDGTGPYALSNFTLPYPAYAGPHVFTSLYDLNKIVDPTDPVNKNFQNGFGTMTVVDPDDSEGDISPVNPTSPVTSVKDGVTGDFEEKYLAINKVSNLITTRSDTFTVYVVVQGWRNIGTTTPELVATRRAAFIVDRSTLTPTNGTPSVTNVPTD